MAMRPADTPPIRSLALATLSGGDLRAPRPPLEGEGRSAAGRRTGWGESPEANGERADSSSASPPPGRSAADLPPPGGSDGENDCVLARVGTALDEVCDPEIPALTIADIGILRDIRLGDDRNVEVIITPTYSGCPAMGVIEFEIMSALDAAGFADARIRTVYSPAWTTDWITEEGRRKLLDSGIAPPAEATGNKRALFGEVSVACPRCDSQDTERVSEFGSTACKALYRCRDCAEPFEYFKCI